MLLFWKKGIAALAAVWWLLGSLLSAGAQEQGAMDRAFEERQWTAVDRLLQKGGLTDREQSLAAGALWAQGRWRESLEIMEKLEGRYPTPVKPWAELLQALALERLDRPREAHGRALSLWQSQPPEQVKYYAAYALARVTTNPEEAVKWLRRMAVLAQDNGQKRTALKALAERDALTGAEALELLKVDPQNSAALAAAEKAAASPQRDYRIGYAHYLAGRHDEAQRWLASLDPGKPYGQSGTYYRAMSLSRLGRTVEAQKLFHRLAFQEGGEYVARSLSRLSLMLGGDAGAAALASLKRAAGDKKPARAAAALNSLATSSRYEGREQAREELLRRFPLSGYAREILWSQGWERWIASDAAGALERWEKASGGDRTQLLYWKSRALKTLGREDEATSLEQELLQDHSLSVYSFFLQSSGSLEIQDIPLPGDLASGGRTELERWGFMAQARLELMARKDRSARAAAARISRWLGQESQAYGDLRSCFPSLLQGKSLPRPLLELAYPRPWRDRVEQAAARWNLDPRLLWAIMRQESAFDPQALSWVGAAGLMQLMPATAADEARRLGLRNYSLFSPGDNIALGAAHIARLIKRFSRLEQAVAAYNAGGGSVSRWNRLRNSWSPESWIEAIPYRETRNYAKAVLANYRIYQKLYPQP